MESGQQGDEGLDSIKGEVDMSEIQQAPYLEFQQSSRSWDSGIVLDSSTVVQMAEFQEVVDALSRNQIQPPPPYPYTRPSVVVTQPPSPSNTSPDTELAELLRGHQGVLGQGVSRGLPHTYQGGREAGQAGAEGGQGRAGARSLPVGDRREVGGLGLSETLGRGCTVQRPPSFKQSTPSCRTNMRQLLWREQCMDGERRRQEAQPASQPSDTLAIPPSSRLTPEIPTDVFKIETRLKNPTKYHLLEAQRQQVADYLSEGDSSLPHNITNPRSSLAVSPATTSVSAPAGIHQGTVTAPFSPETYSSAATSPSEYAASEACDDFLDEFLSQDAVGENSVPDIRFQSTGANLNSASMFNFMVKEEPMGEDDMKVFKKDRVKKDNHNMIERRRRFNINDRITELGTLLPAQNEPYYDLVRDVRQNKGSILKASVDYIKLLRRDRERRSGLEERCRKLEESHRRAMNKLQKYEQQMTRMGVPVEAVAYPPSPEYGPSLATKESQKTPEGPQLSPQGPQLTTQGSPLNTLLLASPRGPPVRRRSAPAGVAASPHQDGGEQEDMEI